MKLEFMIIGFLCEGVEEMLKHIFFTAKYVSDLQVRIYRSGICQKRNEELHDLGIEEQQS